MGGAVDVAPAACASRVPTLGTHADWSPQVRNSDRCSARALGTDLGHPDHQHGPRVFAAPLEPGVPIGACGDPCGSIDPQRRGGPRHPEIQAEPPVPHDVPQGVDTVVALPAGQQQGLRVGHRHLAQGRGFRRAVVAVQGVEVGVPVHFFPSLPGSAGILPERGAAGARGDASEHRHRVQPGKALCTRCHACAFTASEIDNRSSAVLALGRKPGAGLVGP